MNEQKLKSDIRKLVANARAMISYQVGLPFGCMKMSRLLGLIKGWNKEADFPIFEEYITATIDLPTGPERLHCSREALQRYDKRLIPSNLKYREAILDACFAIIEKYGEGKMY